MAITNINEEYLKIFRETLRSPESGISTGFTELDRIIGGGLKKDGFYVIGGRPAMGKTALSLNICRNIVAKGDEKITYCTLGMNTDLLMRRLACIKERIDFWELWRREENALERLDSFLDWKKLGNLTIDDSPDLSVSDIRSGLQSGAYGIPDVLVIDCLQQMTDGEATSVSFRRNNAEHICRELKLIAQEYDLAVVVTSEVNREPERRPDHRPWLADLEDSRILCDHADVVILLYNEGYYDKDSERKGITELFVDSNRFGETGWAEIWWIPQYMTFANMPASGY